MKTVFKHTLYQKHGKTLLDTRIAGSTVCRTSYWPATEQVDAATVMQKMAENEQELAA